MPGPVPCAEQGGLSDPWEQRLPHAHGLTGGCGLIRLPEPSLWVLGALCPRAPSGRLCPSSAAAAWVCWLICLGSCYCQVPPGSSGWKGPPAAGSPIPVLFPQGLPAGPVSTTLNVEVLG